PWVVHSSWTFDTSASKMKATLTAEHLAEMEQSSPSLSSDPEELLSWLNKKSALLHDLQKRFYDAKTIDEAIGHFIAMDIVLSALLLGISKQRLNPKISR
ncbi:MAG: hypothetical protein ABUL58_03285, partial [Steroidobacter sp.]